MGLFYYLVESEGLEPSSKPRELLLSTRLDLINFRCQIGSDQTLPNTYPLNTTEPLEKSDSATLHVDAQNPPSAEFGQG